MSDKKELCMQHKLIVLLYWYELDNILGHESGQTKLGFKEKAQSGFDPNWKCIEGATISIDKETEIADDLEFQLVSCHFMGWNEKDIPQAVYAAIGRGIPEISQAEGLKLWKEARRERKINGHV